MTRNRFLTCLLFLATMGCKSSDSSKVVPLAESGNEDGGSKSAQAKKPLDAGLPLLPVAPPLKPAPLGLPETQSPDYNPTTADKVALGRLLYSDTSLSMSDSDMSCESCHQPSAGFSTPVSIPETASGNRNKRHPPSLWNVGYKSEFYWDGRSKPLEAHILGHWHGQLGIKPEAAIAGIASDPEYRAHFSRAFGSAPSANRAADAIAAYLRVIRNGNSAWDRHEAGESAILSEDAIAGAKIFNERAGCATCHTPPLYSDLSYHPVTAANRADDDWGRFAVSARPEDRAAFHTPSLRGLTSTAPYFHNGSAKTLDDVLAVKEASGSPKLTPREHTQLLAFLRSLSGQEDSE